MSLSWEGNYREAPSMRHYERRELIPEEHRCKRCEGFGLHRARHSQSGFDWLICLLCYGTGRKPIEFADIRKGE